VGFNTRPWDYLQEKLFTEDSHVPETVCIQCQALIEPAEIQHVSLHEIKCPFCDSIFVPKPRERERERERERAREHSGGKNGPTRAY